MSLLGRRKGRGWDARSGGRTGHWTCGTVALITHLDHGIVPLAPLGKRRYAAPAVAIVSARPCPARERMAALPGKGCRDPVRRRDARDAADAALPKPEGRRGEPGERGTGHGVGEGRQRRSGGYHPRGTGPRGYLPGRRHGSLRRARTRPTSRSGRGRKVPLSSSPVPERTKSGTGDARSFRFTSPALGLCLLSSGCWRGRGP